MTSTSFIQIDQTIISLHSLEKVVLDESRSQVLVFVKGRTEAFTISNDNPQQAISFFVNLCAVLQKTQAEVPFFYFSTVALKLSLLSAIHISDNSIVLTSSSYKPDIFAFPNAETANSTWKELMKLLGITSEATGGNPAKPVEPPPTKPPDKPPRKSRRR